MDILVAAIGYFVGISIVQLDGMIVYNFVLDTQQESEFIESEPIGQDIIHFEIEVRLDMNIGVFVCEREALSPDMRVFGGDDFIRSFGARLRSCFSACFLAIGVLIAFAERDFEVAQGEDAACGCDDAVSR